MGCVPSESAKRQRKHGKNHPLPQQKQVETEPAVTLPTCVEKTQSPERLETVKDQHSSTIDSSATLMRGRLFAETPTATSPLPLEDVVEGETEDVAAKMCYTTGGQKVESNIDHLCMGDGGKMRLSGIDENGGFFRLRARFQLDGRVYMEKTFVGVDDEMITYFGHIEGRLISGTLDVNNGAEKGIFEVLLQGEAWRSENGTCYTILSTEEDGKTLCGIGKDSHGFGLWKGLRIENTIDMKIQYADGTEGRFVGTATDKAIARKVESRSGKGEGVVLVRESS